MSAKSDHTARMLGGFMPGDRVVVAIDIAHRIVRGMRGVVGDPEKSGDYKRWPVWALLDGETSLTGFRNEELSLVEEEGAITTPASGERVP